MKTKKLFLASAINFTMDKFLEILSDFPKKMIVGFIPTAADPYKDKWFVDDDKNKFRKAGFRLKEIDLKGENFDSLMNKFGDVDIIFVAGGNTFYLLEKVLESGFDKVVKELLDKGVIYAGSSAGSALACPTIEYIKYFDDPSKAPNLKTRKALGLVDFLILPHYGEKDFLMEYKNFEKHIKDYKYDFIRLTNYEAIVVDDDKYRKVKSNVK